MRALNAGKVQAEYNARKRAEAAAARNGQDSEYRLTAEQKGKGKASDVVGDADDAAAASTNLKIRPGEKLGDFNRRVEQAMASQVAASARSANRKLRKQRRETREKERAEKAEQEERESAMSKGKGKRRKDDGDDDDDRSFAEPSSKDLKRARQEYENRAPAPLDFAKADQRKRVNDVAQAPPRLTKAPRGESKEALARKARLAAALQGSDDPDGAARAVLASRRRTVTQGQMPEPIAQRPPAGLKRQKDLADERERVIKMYRKKKQDKIAARG